MGGTVEREFTPGKLTLDEDSIKARGFKFEGEEPDALTLVQHLRVFDWARERLDEAEALVIARSKSESSG